MSVLKNRVGAVAIVASLALSTAACSGSHTEHSAATTRVGYLATSGSNPVVGAMLAASSDLGPSHARDVDVLVALPRAARPTKLLRWAHTHDLRAQWQHGNAYAMVRGTAPAMSAGFAVSIHDYRAKSGRLYYATRRYAAVPRALRHAVTGVGSILSYFPPTHPASLLPFHQDVPAGGLTPSQLLRTYDAAPLAQAGYTGKGKTVVFFELDGYTQADMDKYAQLTGTRRFTPVLDSTMPGKIEGETEMDLEVVHALVPDARLVVYNINTAWTFGSSLATYSVHIANSYKQVEQKYPGSVWSISIGSACDRYFTATDLQPMQAALQQATARGTSVFMSSGDTGGLECKGNANAADFGSPPSQADVGVSAINTPPSLTSVGGTQVDTDAKGGWISEEAWTQFATQQGTSGGPSLRFARPSWQTGPELSSMTDTAHRLTPDVAADADSETGVKTVIDGKVSQGGGTSQAAPIWAGLTVMMNQYLEANGSNALGNINPLLYRAAATTPSAFHDVTLGGNVPYLAGKGYDLLTGLGAPSTAVLVKALQAAQKAGS
ncbi:MAG TPA: S53 family peptidase [Jatrophihabitans sp.]|jgi:kumamolisin